MSQYADQHVLVDTQWLEEHLNDPKLRVIAAEANPQLYNDAHIPGAVFWSLTDLLLPDFRTNFDPASLEKLLSRSGISNDTTVIALGSYPGTSGWIFWLLKVFGHDFVCVLNGGYQKWMAENRPVTTDVPIVTPTIYRAQVPNPSLRVSFQEVQASLDRSDCVLLDVRTPLS